LNITHYEKNQDKKNSIRYSFVINTNVANAVLPEIAFEVPIVEKDYKILLPRNAI
jgi:hypothetical protein